MLIFLMPVLTLNPLNYLSNKTIKIFFSNHPNHLLVRNMSNFGDTSFEIVEYPHLSKYNSDAKIERDGLNFSIKIGDKYLCYDIKVYSCNEPHLWLIRKSNSGFEFVKDNRCLSYTNNMFVLEECRNNPNQVFDFFAIPDILKCLDNNLNYNQLIKKIKKSQIDQINNLGELLKDVINEKEEPKTFNDFINKIEPKYKDKAKNLRSLWNFRNPYKFKKFPIKPFLDFMCPK